MGSTRISSYTKILHGKVVRVNAYTVNRGAGEVALHIPGRPFMSATPGQFPNGRGLPGIFPIDEIHGGSDTGMMVQDALDQAKQKAAQVAPEGTGPASLPSVPKKTPSAADIAVQLKKLNKLVSDATVGSAVDLARLWQYVQAAENVLTAAEAAKTTARATDRLRHGPVST